MKGQNYIEGWALHIEQEFVINKIQKGDEHEISAMVKRVFEDFVASDYTSDGRRRYLEFINPSTIYSRNFCGDSHTLVCRAGDRIVGILEIQGWKHILLLFVDSEFHGRGIARELLGRAIKFSKEKAESKAVTVNASPYAEPIYKKLGFVPLATQTVKDGIKYTPMRLDL